MRDGLADIFFYASIPLAVAVVFVALVWAVQLMRQRHTPEHPLNFTIYRVPLLASMLCLVAGLAITFVYADGVRRAAIEDAQTRFLQQTGRVEAELLRQVADLNPVLQGVRGLVATHPHITQQQFRDFVRASDVQQGLGGARGLGLIERVPRQQLSRFVASQRNQGWPDYQVRTLGGASDLFLIRALEPAGRNQGVVGYDIGSDPVRRTAAEAAMHSGAPTLSPRISLLQDELKRPAFLLLLPFYGGDAVPDEDAQRVRTLRGWVYAPVVFSELVAHGPLTDQQAVNFQLFDASTLNAQSLIYDSVYPSGNVRDPTSLVRYTHSLFSVVRPVMVDDQLFYLRAHSTPEFETTYHPEEHRIAAAVGAGLSVLLAMVLWLLMAGRAQAIDLARRMTLDLDRLAMVARRTSNAVFFTDTARNITWVNEGFTRLSGFSPAEALGRQPGGLLQSPLTDAQLQGAAASQDDTHHRVQVQVPQRNKAGAEYWVDMEVLPLRGADARVTGYLAVQSDITAEVQVKAALLLEKERADTILSGTNVGTWDSNLMTGVQQWNERWSAMMGFNHDEVRPNADIFWQQRLHPVDRERLNQAMAACLSGAADSYSCDVRAQRKDGSWMWILSRAKVMARSADGRVERIGGIHTDITDIKQVELSLRDMEAFLDRAGRIAGVGAWQIDLKSREMVFSAQTAALHGLAPGFHPSEEVALSFYPEADRQRLQLAMQRAEKYGESWDLVLEFHNAQGEQRWVRVFGEVGFDAVGPARLVGAFQDVTQDRLAQQEVERSGALLRGAIEAINEAFVLFDPQDRLVFCNDKYRAIYARSAHLMVEGATFESIIRGGAELGQYLEAMGRVDEWVDERMAAHRRGNVSTEQRLHDGRWLKILERRMPDGHMVGFRVDITELKLATAAAESTSAKRGEEQRRMQTILEGTNVGTWEWNVQTGDCIYNDQYVAMLGFTLKELEPLNYDTWVRLVHPDDLVNAAQHMQQHLSDAAVSYEVEARLRHKHGHWIWVLSKGKLASRTADGRPLWIYGTHMDITERKLAEQQLAQTSATLQNVLDSATAVGVMTLALDGRINMFNRGAENLLGFAAADVIGLQSASIFFDRAEWAALRETLALMWGREPAEAEVLAHVGDIRDEQEWTLVRQDGSRFKANLIFSPLLDAQGASAGKLAMVYDVSKQKEYESSLRDAMRLAEQSSVAKSQFLANMSHEIRTPMNAILGMLQLLRNTPLQPNQKDYAEKAAGAARSLLGLLNDILDFSKVEAGKMQLNPEPFVLEGLLDDLSVILSSNLGGKNVDLLFDVDPAIPRELIGDAMRLKQILINLGGNAVKFTEQGQVVIRWKRLAQTPEWIKVGVEVEDTGIGIAPENQARIFDAFTQAEANTTRRFGGTGLGLVISTRLIQMMGGTLQLRSALGQGSTFSFTLELALPDRGQVALAGPAEGAPRLRVLLVDDNPVALLTSTAMAQSLGWEVLQATSGEDALAQLAACLRAPVPLDALFVDAQMPGMDGWETLRNVRRLYGPLQPPPLILLSRQSLDALAQRSEREQALMDGLLVKPLTAAMFAHALAQARPGAGEVDKTAVRMQGRPLEGMRILLVEDNAINQQVAQELLSAEGARVVLADNGAIGVDALHQTPDGFDVVLMDLQMPVMDGLTATRLLRREPRFAALPIIAMTANAMGSDREACLQAGMNDHVGKPFDVNQLVKTLLAHTGWTRQTVGVQDAGAATLLPVAPASAAPLWPGEVDVEQALARMGGNRSLLQRSITAFLADAQGLPERLRQLANAADWPQMRRELHALKGLSATVGLANLAVLAAQAEQQMPVAGPQEGYPAAVDTLGSALAQASPVLQQVATQLGRDLKAAPAAAKAWSHALQLQLQELLQLLQKSDMAAMELHAQLRDELGDSDDPALLELDAAMADLEFEAASLACEKLVQQSGQQ